MTGSWHQKWNLEQEYWKLNELLNLLGPSLICKTFIYIIWPHRGNI